MTVEDRPDWYDQAACADADTSIFYPAVGETADGARVYCRRCPVRDDCLDHALRTVERFGIWGGLSPNERRRLRVHHGITSPRPRPPRPAPCGTDAGYQRHQRRGEPACPACREAHARANDARRRSA